MTRPRLLAVFTLALVAMMLALAAAWTAPGRAQATPAPPLTGTTLLALEFIAPLEGTIDIVADCDLPRPTISYTATGTAVGTYMGPYTETGTAVLASTLGPVEEFTAEFTIDSSIGFVHGFKTLSSMTGTCPPLPDVGTGSVEAEGVATYVADITTATGTCRTQGTSQVDVFDNVFGPTTFEEFSEEFLTGTPCMPICPPGDDEDDDGLRDDREGVFSTLLGNSDSDLDGIADGNDDGNGNGEDDEDEDDDEDDGCPDEDDDDDGEDDEDEDDDEDDDD